MQVTTSHTHVRKRIAKVRLLMQEGSSRAEAIQALMDDPEKPVSRSTAIRTVNYVESEGVKELNKARAALQARQWRKLDRVQRLALSMQKTYVHWEETVEGEMIPLVHKESQPDLAAFNAAVAQQSKLAGLNAPDRREIISLNLGEMIQDMVSVARQFIPDKEQRKLFVEALAVKLEERKRQKPAMVPADIVEAKQIEAKTVEHEDTTGNGHIKNGKQ